MKTQQMKQPLLNVSFGKYIGACLSNTCYPLKRWQSSWGKAKENNVAQLPDIQGYGKLNSLHQAMAGKANLTALVTLFIQPTLSSNERSALINNIIYTWAGVESVDPASRSSRMIYGNAIGDARKLEALEEFMGQAANDEDWRMVA